MCSIRGSLLLQRYTRHEFAKYLINFNIMLKGLEVETYPESGWVSAVLDVLSLR